MLLLLLFYNEILCIYFVLFHLQLYLLSILLIFGGGGGGLDRGIHSVDVQPDFVCGGWGGGGRRCGYEGVVSNDLEYLS